MFVQENLVEAFQGWFIYQISQIFSIDVQNNIFQDAVKAIFGLTSDAKYTPEDSENEGLEELRDEFLTFFWYSNFGKNKFT
jgi:hypothetical protein